MTSATASSQSHSRIEILGLPVDRVTMKETLEQIEGFIAADRCHLVITADASGLVQAQTDPYFQELFAKADLITPDSVGVLWAAKRFGTPLAERVSGVDIVQEVCKASSYKGYRIYFLGAAPGVAELAAEKLRLRFPGCNIVGARHGYFPPESDTVVAQEVAETKPDVLFVAMGIPRQEKFIEATSGIIGAKVAMGVGGSFDVFSGKVRRAPELFQRMRLEWLWRLLQNPKKIGKVLLLPRFVILVLKAKR
jgi:N-acetylglucosaminyldiphosphoundecaprenol N-acetyl-beta-D-mannosaminyltransferase